MSPAPLVGVLALQGDVREHCRALRAAGARAEPMRDAAGLSQVDGLVIPGGESTTMSKLAVRDGLMTPLRAAREAGLPMYGSCAGMIMLAERILDARDDQETIGGIDVTVRRNAFGRQVDSFEGDLDIPAFGPAPFPGVFIRAPWVESAGPQVEIIGRLAARDDAGDEGRIVAVRQGPLLATSFHPELTGDIRVHEYFVEIVRQRA